MKRIIVSFLLIMLVLTGLFIILLFHIDDNEPQTAVVVIPEEKEETKEEMLPLKKEETYPDDVYLMLDFDRRLILAIGQQDKDLCSIYDLAYARSVLDNRQADPYDYYDGNEAVWYLADYDDIAGSDPLDKVLQKARAELEKGRPVIFFVDGEYGFSTGSEPVKRKSYDHYVLLIGYRLNADPDDLKVTDFYAADPSGGYCCDAEGYMPWITLSDEAPQLVSGEYALYAPIDPQEHVSTCIAYPDKATWDSSLKEAIYPDYYQDSHSSNDQEKE